MAFTAQDRTDIRLYLGYAARFYQTINSALEQAMNAVESDATVVTAIEALIADCKLIDQTIKDARRRLKMIQAEDVRYAGMQEIAGLRSEGRVAVGRIAAFLGCPVKHDAFSASGSNDTPPFTFGGATGGSGMKLG
jgi:hypothetical protein